MNKKFEELKILNEKLELYKSALRELTKWKMNLIIEQEGNNNYDLCSVITNNNIHSDFI